MERTVVSAEVDSSEEVAELFCQLQAVTIETLYSLGARALERPYRYTIEASSTAMGLAIRPECVIGGADSPIAFGRVVHVDGGSGAQVFNIVLFPRPGSGLPVLGCEILCFKKGVHLFVLDGFGFHQSAIEAALSQRLKPIGRELEQRFCPSSLPEWSENVFSADAIVLKPGARARATVAPFQQAFEAFLGAYLDAARQVRQVGFDFDADARRRRKDYLAEQARHEPARPFLQRVAGEQWVEDFIHEFLYPTWLHDGDRAPSWLGHSMSRQDH
jgi:15,16-dihydrobiliverdin:ferredoxin oxidoreductase